MKTSNTPFIVIFTILGILLTTDGTFATKPRGGSVAKIWDQ